MAWLFVTLAQNTLLVALSSPKYLQVGIPVPNIVIETPFNNLSVSKGRITRTGLMVYICNDGFCSLVLSFWMPAMGLGWLHPRSPPFGRKRSRGGMGKAGWEGVFPQPVLHRLIYRNESHCSQHSPWGQVAAEW